MAYIQLLVTIFADSYEAMAPEKTSNPILLRFLDIIQDLAFDPDSHIPGESSTTDLLLSIPATEAREDAVRLLSEQFPIQTKVWHFAPCRQISLKLCNVLADANMPLLLPMSL